jgi:hypothetical protein
MNGLRPSLSLRSPTRGAKKKPRKVLATRLFRLAHRTTSECAAWEANNQQHRLVSPLDNNSLGSDAGRLFTPGHQLLQEKWKLSPKRLAVLLYPVNPCSIKAVRQPNCCCCAQSRAVLPGKP